MSKLRHCFFYLIFAGILCPLVAVAQIDPAKRELVQIGYNQSLIGQAPLSAYAFYYYNKPDFLNESNLTLRLAVAPVYVDSELGISHALGPDTDVGIGLAGGGFADSYYEVRQGKYLKAESFDGDGVTGSGSIYHLFNPGQRIPLNGLFRVEGHYADYIRDDTAPNFVLPKDMTDFNIRTGFRFGGKEPVMVPDMAMELSLWYEGQFRLNSGDYGFNNDRHVNSISHLFWGRALLAYTLPESKQNFLVSVTAGDSIQADRFSAYRIGGFLPLAAEFPLSLPGYFYQELSATRFALFNVNYTVPIDAEKRFAFTAIASTAIMEYLPGLEQPGHWNSGVGGGLSYHSHSDAWRVLVDYGYGFNAIRDNGRGGQTIGILLQINLERTHPQYVVPGSGSGILRGLGDFTHSIF
ncbi:MAG TPA: hypothetical protein VG754_13460 [Verrucomicrobiae bacterium]|nr:hypothetical protein [Verrucomicrobiae bacterium]